MTTEIKSVLDELKGVALELYNLNIRLKELRGRKKELESQVVVYLDENEKQGLRSGDITFVKVEKNTRARKKKDEVVRDSFEVLKKHGVAGDLSLIFKELEDSRKGDTNSVSVLKMKAKGLWD
jgi:hypothetical protein